MTVLTAIQSAILRLSLAPETAIFASTERIAIEMVDLVNEVATDIAKSQDWRNLTAIGSLTGGGETHALPVDFDRMVLASDIDNASSWFWGYQPFNSVNDWMRFKSGGYAAVSPGGWIILGGEFQFYPAISGAAQFPYIRKTWAKDTLGAVKGAFTDDSDTFVLDERLLTLGLIWRYQAQKGDPYSESLATYETALAQAQSRDKGARVLRTPTRSGFYGRLAYSGYPIG